MLKVFGHKIGQNLNKNTRGNKRLIVAENLRVRKGACSSHTEDFGNDE